MKLIIQTKNIDLTSVLQEWVEEKVGSLSKFLKEKDGDLIKARVEIGKPSRHHQSGFVYYAEINLKIGRKLLRASVEHLDLRTAIDQARDELEVQIKKFKGKMKAARRRAV